MGANERAALSVSGVVNGRVETSATGKSTSERWYHNLPASLVVLLVFEVTLIIVLVVTLPIFTAWWLVVRMPGRSYRGSLPPLGEEASLLRENLQRDLNTLAEDIGPRNVSHSYDQLVGTVEFLETSLQEVGFDVRRQEFTVDGKSVCNLDVECRGEKRPEHILVVGAHYDTVPGSPGANDNGSAVVATLALARAFAKRRLDSTICFAFFVNEESPYYMTEAMGSLRYAQKCQEEGERLMGMISLETIGCYETKPSTQRYPIGLLNHFYPTTGDFAAVVGNLRSRRFVHNVIRALRKSAFPTEGIAAPSWLKDIFRSDHAAFWSCGFPGLMITDTANFRYPHYHTAGDTVDKINFTALAALVTALIKGLDDLTTDGGKVSDRRPRGSGTAGN